MNTNLSRIVTRILAAAGVIWCVGRGSMVESQTLLDPTTLTKFIDPLPNPLSNVIAPVGTDSGIDLYHVDVTQFTQNLHSELADTTVWGYNGTYPGPTFDVDRGVPIKVDWVNNLVDGSGSPLPHILPYDDTVHGAWSGFAQSRIVTHLHGGVVEPESDGFPEHWYTSDPNAPANGMGGPAGNSARYTYHNQQPASTLWYHDHGMGITRLNVYAGLAGFYLLRDEQEQALNLPGGAYEMPLVIQDRSFYSNGEFFYPRGPGDLTDPGGPDPLAGLPPDFTGTASVVPHFVGNTNLVNGTVWPFMEVEPRKYRFRIVNGANSRFYDLKLEYDDGGGRQTLPFHQIGSDGGLLESTTTRNSMLMAPAERSDVIVDFSGLAAGEEVLLRNFGPDGIFEGPDFPYSPADPSTTGQVMQFKVAAPTGTDTSSLPTSLVSVPRIPESEAIATRQLTLNNDVDEFGRPKLLLDGAKWTDPTTELPVQGTTEIWEIRNSTTDSHPIHLHLVQFQVLDRFARPAGGGDPVEVPLEPYELGWKDTVQVNRRETVRVIARFEDFDGLYVWHCHILEHEDHEMMRVYEVVPGPELVVEQGATLTLTEPHTVPGGYYMTVDGTFTTPQLNMDGLLRGLGVVDSSITVTGDVSPGGEDTGTISIAGDMTLRSSSTLSIELAGTGDGQFDAIDVDGLATLDGRLRVQLFDTGQGGTYAPTLGDTFDILTAAGGVTGMWDVDVRTAVDGGLLSLETVYNANSVQLVVVSGLPGDLNNDGSVDAADASIVFANWGPIPPADPIADMNDDGFVDAADASVLFSNWTGDTHVVPEPVGEVPMALTFLVFAFCCGGVLDRQRYLAKEKHAIVNASPLMDTWRTTMSATRWQKNGRTKLAFFLFSLAILITPDCVMSTLVTLTPTQDNTLYEDPDGSLSNGAGEYMFVGLTDNSEIRRAVMAFDIAGSIPSNSVIQSATLNLFMSRSRAEAVTVDLHRLTSDWGESSSNADGEEGEGASAAPNDATWIHTFYPSSTWSTPGGDYAPNASASTSVPKQDRYNLWGSTPQMVADVQGWLDDPGSDFGWILIGDEQNPKSAKRFNTHEINEANRRPFLEIVYEVQAGPTIFSWTGAGAGGSFHEPNNWDVGQAPSDPTDIVNLINNDPNNDQTATMSTNVTIDDLTINGGLRTMTLGVPQAVTANVGDLVIGGDGGLAIEAATGTSGQLNATGSTTLDGTLAFSTPGLVPTATETFAVVTYGSRIGRFATISNHEIEPGRSFSLHYNDIRALAIAGEWAASGLEIAGDADVPGELLVSGAWSWNGILVKRGDGDLILELDEGYTAGIGAALALIDGKVRFRGTSPLTLGALTYGELGALSGNASLAGEYGWYGTTTAVPEPNALILAALGGAMALCRACPAGNKSACR